MVWFCAAEFWAVDIAFATVYFRDLGGQGAYQCWMYPGTHEQHNQHDYHFNGPELLSEILCIVDYNGTLVLPQTKLGTTFRQSKSAPNTSHGHFMSSPMLYSDFRVIVMVSVIVKPSLRVPENEYGYNIVASLQIFVY